MSNNNINENNNVNNFTEVQMVYDKNSDDLGNNQKKYEIFNKNSKKEMTIPNVIEQEKNSTENSIKSNLNFSNNNDKDFEDNNFSDGDFDNSSDEENVKYIIFIYLYIYIILFLIIQTKF